MRGETAGLDWLEVSSQIVAGLLRRHGYEPAWAQPVTWEAYAATRYEAVREQLRSVLNASRRRSGRFGPDDLGWPRPEKKKIRVRVRTNTHGDPEFNWRDLPTYMLHEHESRGGEFVLDTNAVETFLGQRITASRWRLPLLARSALSRANHGNRPTPVSAPPARRTGCVPSKVSAHVGDTSGAHIVQ